MRLVTAAVFLLRVRYPTRISNQSRDKYASGLTNATISPVASFAPRLHAAGNPTFLVSSTNSRGCASERISRCVPSEDALSTTMICAGLRDCATNDSRHSEIVLML